MFWRFSVKVRNKENFIDIVWRCWKSGEKLDYKGKWYFGWIFRYVMATCEKMGNIREFR